MTLDPGFDVELGGLEIATLLDREDVIPSVPARLVDSSILVTGAGGSIGSLLVRRLARSGARVLALDRAEAGLFLLGLRLTEEGRAERVRLIVRDAGSPSIASLLAEEEVDLVVHAAAHKHVGLMEGEVDEAWRNNVEATRRLLDTASKAGVADFLLVSTDKAVAPTSVMGRTKAAAERLVLTRFRDAMRRRILRLPNVLGSAGSVAQVFRRSLLRGEALSLRDRRAERLYVGPGEAVAALFEAMCWRQEGLLAPASVSAIGLEELALRAQDLWAPDRELDFRDLGLGPGERLSECLVGADEVSRPGPEGLVLIERRQNADADRRADQQA